MLSKENPVRSKIDFLRRLFIPNQMQKKLNCSPGQELELSIQYGKIHIKKFQKSNWQASPFTGIVRTLDSQHRVCIPVEYLRLFGDTVYDVDLTFENDSIKVTIL